MVIDGGASHVAAGVFARKKGRLRLEEFAVETFAVPAGGEASGSDSFRRALAAVVARIAFRGPAVVVLPGHLVLAKFIRTPRLAAAKLGRVVHFEAQQSLPHALTDLAWGHAVTGESDLGLDVLLCAAKLGALDPLCAAVEAAGFAPRALRPGVLALRAAVADVAADGPMLVANLGARSTTLLLLERHRWHARVLGLGGQHVTQPLAERRGCDSAAAEAEKISGRDPAALATALEPFVTRLSQEVARSVAHFQHTAGAAAPSRVVLTGGASLTTGLAERLAARLNLRVELHDPLAAVDLQPAAVAAGAAAFAPHLADLVGAARAEFADESAPINLLPPRRLAPERARRRQPWLAAAAVLAAAAFVPPLRHYRACEAALRRQIATLDAEIVPLRQREAMNRAQLERLAALQRQIGALHGIAVRRAAWRRLLADLQDRFVAVEDVWLERVQLMPGSAAADAPLRIAVSGRLLDRAHPRAPAGPDLHRRVTALLASVAAAPGIAAVENERFDSHQPGLLGFEVVLVAGPAQPL